MLRFDCTDFSADPIENMPEAVTDDFLRLCYGEDILDLDHPIWGKNARSSRVASPSSMDHQAREKRA